VQSTHLDEVVSALRAKKANLNFKGEVKWNKVPGHKAYAKKYIDLMDTFFDLIEAGKIKIRIMFRQNTIRHRNLTREHFENKYFILYYTFLKSAFGLDCSPIIPGGVRLRIYPDQIPDKIEKIERFANFLLGMAKRTEFRIRNITIRREDITGIISHDHDVLQCLDIVLGAMHFRLNDLHKEKPEKGNNKLRAPRTRRKEDVYKHINWRIRKIYPGFNIGISTGRRAVNSRWADPYRHWRLMPKAANRVVLPGSKKKKKK
jgi:hypothetical protein